jgi:drug/metabolite transporter (DMT)-like permease
MQRLYWTLLLLLVAIWGSSYLFIEIGLREMSRALVVLLRLAFGAAVLLPIAWRRGALDGLAGLWSLLALVAAVQVAAPFLLIAEGQQEITSALAGILVSSVPIFTAILAIFFDPGDRSDGLRGVGVLLGIVGVAVLLGVDLGGSSALLLGGLAVVLASLGYAIGGLITRKKLGSVQPLGVAAVVLSLGTAMAVPFALATLPAAMPGAGPIAAGVALGVLGTGVAFAIFYGLLARVGPSRTFVVTDLAPGFAVIYGATLLGEEVAIATLVGLGLILAGSFLAAEGRLPGRPARVPAGGAPGAAPRGAAVDAASAPEEPQPAHR